MTNRRLGAPWVVLVAAIILGACAPATGTPAVSVATPAPLASPTGNGAPPLTAASPTATPAELLTAASLKSKDPTTFTYLTQPGDPSTLDPAFNYETNGAQVILNTYDTLIFYDRQHADQFVPQLATDVPSQSNGGLSADGQTYTFKIRTGVMFHNGDTLTPDDVAFTFQRGLLQGGSTSPQWLLFQPILGVAASPSGNNDITDLVDPSGKLGDDKADLLKADPARLLAACQTVSNAIVADDAAHTVTFHLAQPWAPFLAIIANTWGSISEKKWIGANGGWDGDCKDWQNFYQTSSLDLNKLGLGALENGTGPYRLDHWTPNQEVVLKAFDSYWRGTPAWPGGPSGAPRLKTLIFKTNVAQFATRLAALQAGDADLIDPGSPADWAQMDPLVGEVCDASGACRPAANPNGSLRLFKNLPAANRTDVFFNFKIDTTGGNAFIGSGQLDGNGIPPDFFTDVHVRRGFNYCFDWAAYIKDVLLGEGVQSYDVMLPGEIGYSDQDPHYSYDPDKCRSELQSSTLKAADGRSLWDIGFRLSIAYNAGNTQRQAIAETLSQDLKAVNPKFIVEVTGLPNQTYFAAQQAHTLPIYLNGWLEDIHDPHDWLEPYVSGGYGQQQSLPAELLQTLNDFVDRGVAETDPAKRANIYHQFNLAFYDAAPDILLAVQGYREYQQRWVQGWYFNPIYPGLYYYALSKQ